MFLNVEQDAEKTVMHSAVVKDANLAYVYIEKLKEKTGSSK